MKLGTSLHDTSIPLHVPCLLFSLVQIPIQSSPTKATDRQSLIGPHLPISAQSIHLVVQPHLHHRLIAAYREHLGSSLISSLATLGLVNPLDGRQTFFTFTDSGDCDRASALPSFVRPATRPHAIFLRPHINDQFMSASHTPFASMASFPPSCCSRISGVQVPRVIYATSILQSGIYSLSVWDVTCWILKSSGVLM